VSNGGGTQPRWSHDGRELFFLDAKNRLMSAEIRRSTTFDVGDLRPLFDASAYAIDNFHTSYDVLPGGGGFVFNRQVRLGRETTTRLVLVDNWFADVRGRTGGR
jgi:hypothetical protein